MSAGTVARLRRSRRALLLMALMFVAGLFALDRYAALAYVPPADSTRVVLYTTAWCPYCKRLREDLRASGVPYTEIDVEKSVQGYLAFWALRARGIPVSAIGPNVVYGYRVEEIGRALSALGYTFVPRAGGPSRDAEHEPTISPTKRLGLGI